MDNYDPDDPFARFFRGQAFEEACTRINKEERRYKIMTTFLNIAYIILFILCLALGSQIAEEYYREQGKIEATKK